MTPLRASSGVAEAVAAFTVEARRIQNRAQHDGRPGPLDPDVITDRAIVDQIKLLLEQALLEPPGLPWINEAGAWTAILAARVVRERLVAPESSDEDEAA
jgi:hypothetical protein